jgi:hypothetical protein
MYELGTSICYPLTTIKEASAILIMIITLDRIEWKAFHLKELNPCSLPPLQYSKDPP